MKFMLFSLCLLLLSCDPCKNLDCVTDNVNGQFRVTNGATGTDLVFGPGKIYDKSQIRFYSMNGTDTVFLPYQPIPYNFNGIDSILVVQFLPKPGVAYMRLNSTDTDTLNISYNTRATKCCGNVTDIVRFNFNQGVDLPANMAPHELRK